MQSNKGIAELDLSDSCDMDALSFEALEKNKSLVKLTLSGNRMSHSACKKIAPFITHHPSINCIELDRCLDDRGIKIIGDAVTGAATVRSLSLEENHCSDVELASFIKQLKGNDGLVSLKVKPVKTNGQRINGNMPAAVREGILHHSTLVHFDHWSAFRYISNYDDIPSDNLLSPALFREIDRHLRSNLVLHTRAVGDYLRGFMNQFAWKILRFADIGDVIWQYFIKDVPGDPKGGALADVAALRDALHVRQVMMGAPEFRGAPVDPQSQTQDPSEEPAKKRQKT